MRNILTVDLEDWLHSSLELFDGIQGCEEVYRPTERVVWNTQRLLRILEENRTKATFFVLGTVGESFPELIKDINRHGHEVATHGYSHTLVYRQTKEEFRQDLRKSINIIQNISGEKILGYRAPYFSIREDSIWAIDVLKEEGLTYDASIFPLRRRLYGVKDMDKVTTNGIIEFPVSKMSFFGYEFPFGGGGYLRLFPYALTKWAIRRLNKQGKSAVCYIHPYEIETSDFQNYGLENNVKTRFITFAQKFNREKTEHKIRSSLRDFEFTAIKYLLEPSTNPI
jgi:polysaccharide deacetylase family protein (PEP-CTERM system associated)